MTVWEWSPTTKSKWALKMTCGVSVLSFRRVGPGSGAHFQPWQKAPLPTEPSQLPNFILFSVSIHSNRCPYGVFICMCFWVTPSQSAPLHPSPCLPFPLVAFHGSILPSSFHVTHVLLSLPCRSPKTSSSLLHTVLSSFQVSIHSLPHPWRLEARILMWESTCGACFSDLELPHSIEHFPENSIISVFFYTIPLCVITP